MPVYGGIFREEAIMLLRKFYVQENEKGACLQRPHLRRRWERHWIKALIVRTST